MEVSSEPKRLYVVMDVGAGGELSYKNNIFDRALTASKYKSDPLLLMPAYLYDECLKRGIQLLTPDLYFAMDPKPANAIFFHETIDNQKSAEEIIASGIRPAILRAYENPLYMCQFFYHLEKNTRPFDHVFVPKGAVVRVSKKAKAHPWVAPMPYETGRAVPGGFMQRKFLTMINGNARIQFLRRWYVHFWNALKPYPSLVDREIYVDRLDAISFFANDPEFDLYGRGWDRPVRYTREYDAAIKKVNRGEVVDKIATLEKYRFCLIFENCIFEGWVTEKIIDALAAGCIPIYWGAPDIVDYVPENCFIDFRKFKNLGELNVFLKNIDERTYDGYIENMKVFFASDLYHERWSKEKFAKDIIAIFETYVH